MKRFFVPKQNVQCVKYISGTNNKGSSNFRILHQNIAGLCNKLNNVEIFLSELESSNREIDVLCFSETFIKKNNEDNVILENYKLASFYCRDDKSRGGLCIMVKKRYCFKPVNIPSKFVVKFNFECFVLLCFAVRYSINAKNNNT